MTAIVVLLDVVEVHGGRDTGPLVKLAGVIPQIVIIGQPSQIAFEMTVVNTVKTDECGEQTPVCFGQAISEQTGLPSELVFNGIKTGKQFADFGFVDLLLGGKAGLVNPIV